jgi:hypothetical protein
MNKLVVGIVGFGIGAGSGTGIDWGVTTGEASATTTFWSGTTVTSGGSSRGIVEHPAKAASENKNIIRLQ